jgi:hypothetical protein
MDFENIKDLIEKYWRCETSIEEEKFLKEYFSQPGIPEDLKPYAGLFQFYNSIDGLEPPNDFNADLLNNVNSDLVANKKLERKNYSWIYKSAAVISLAVASIFVYEKIASNKNESEIAFKDSFDNPEDALKEAKRAILMVSNKLDKGKKAAFKISLFGKTEDLIRKHQN